MLKREIIKTCFAQFLIFFFIKFYKTRWFVRYAFLFFGEFGQNIELQNFASKVSFVNIFFQDELRLPALPDGLTLSRKWL